MKKNLINIFSFVFLFSFLLVSILVLVVDVEMNFRTGTKVGLYTINQSFAKNYVKDSFDLISLPMQISDPEVHHFLLQKSVEYDIMRCDNLRLRHCIH